MFSDIHDLRNLMNEIQKDSLSFRLFDCIFYPPGYISAGEFFMKDSCCVRGRLCAIHSPGHWTRDLLRHPPCAAELPDDFLQSFLLGKPWYFSQHVFEPWSANKQFYPVLTWSSYHIDKGFLEFWFYPTCHSIIWQFGTYSVMSVGFNIRCKLLMGQFSLTWKIMIYITFLKLYVP